MKIVLYSHSFLPKIGGREIVVYQLARALTARGHDVRVVGPATSTRAVGSDFGVMVKRYPRFRSKRPIEDRYGQLLLEMQMCPQLRFDLAVRGADVIHAHSLYPAGYVAARLRKAVTATPLILTPHGIDINTAADRHYGLRLNAGLRKKIDYALEKADAVTAISEGVYRELIGAHVDAEKIHRINNGVDLARFDVPSNCNIREYLCVEPDAKLILTVGNYTPLKGHEDLILAMPGITAKVPSARLVIVGAHTAHLKDVAEKAGVIDSVVLTGPIPLPGPLARQSGPQDLLAAIYQESSVYVSASNREGAEGLSLSLLDALAAGMPVVATNIVGNRDVVSDGINGYLVSLNDQPSLVSAISKILIEDSLRTAFGKSSRALADQFGWDSVANSYEQLYESEIRKSR